MQNARNIYQKLTNGIKNHTMPIAKTCKQNLTEKRFCTTSTPDCKCYAHKRLVCNACQTCVSSTFDKLQKSQNQKLQERKFICAVFGITTQYEQRDFCILPQYCTKQNDTEVQIRVVFQLTVVYSSS